MKINIGNSFVGSLYGENFIIKQDNGNGIRSITEILKSTRKEKNSRPRRVVRPSKKKSSKITKSSKIPKMYKCPIHGIIEVDMNKS